jgi:C1A family cysteine protease
VGAYKIIEPKKVQANVDSHKAAITLRPIAVNVDATNWQLYESGIFDQCTTNTNHVALAVGFGDGYWLIKNSWGTGWGVNGYIKIKDGNTCGFLTQSYMAT